MPTQYGNLERVRIEKGTHESRYEYRMTIWHDELEEKCVVASESERETRRLAHVQAVRWTIRWNDQAQGSATPSNEIVELTE